MKIANRNTPVLDSRGDQGELEEENVAQRLWTKDPSLWKSDPAVQESIRRRLGWLDLPAFMASALPEINAFVSSVKAAGFKDVVLLGMGGSSLCPEVLRLVFGARAGFPRLHVLDTTDPAAIDAVASRLSLKKTLFLVSSKSGGTIEVMSLFHYFWGLMEGAQIEDTGSHFAAITDPGTSLESLGKQRRFRQVFLSRTDVGGRFSALAFFGLVPAALLGIDVRKLLDRAAAMANACGPEADPARNPGLVLGAWLAAGKESKRDKLTLVTSKRLASFGLWVEQLIAESTGKEGVGILPVESEPALPLKCYAPDRLFVFMTLRGSKDAVLEKRREALERAGHPVFRIEMRDHYDLAAEFFRWEIATAAAGHLLGINPFDEPNVSESKANTLGILERFEIARALPEPPATGKEKNIRFWTLDGSKPVGLGAAFKRFLNSRKKNDYIALMAYLTPTPAVHRALQAWRGRLALATGLATTLGYGPRFLHSTGQLHKGGDANGLFIQITGDDAKDLPVPGKTYGFSVLKRSQALGDIKSLKHHKRRVFRVHLTVSAARDIARLASLTPRS